jgi:ubiquinone/menaquinone biosynthesis C-methylase UbiE
MSEGTTINADRDLKARHRAMWALGDYPAVARDITAPLAEVLAEACQVAEGQHVLDVAAGTGNVAVAAARRGARVTATDLTPELLDVGQRETPADLAIHWQVADAEDLPFEDATFDVVASCVGVMFAPHHQQTADELLRVCRPGGTIGLLNWTPSGFIGQVFATMKPFLPPPPPGAQPAPLWGSPDHVSGLFGDRVTGMDHQIRTLHVDVFADPEAFRDYFRSNYGPTISAYRANGSDPARVEAIDQALVDLATRCAGPDGTWEWEYLLSTARRR